MRSMMDGFLGFLSPLLAILQTQAALFSCVYRCSPAQTCSYFWTWHTCWFSSGIKCSVGGWRLPSSCVVGATASPHICRLYHSFGSKVWVCAFNALSRLTTVAGDSAEDEGNAQRSLGEGVAFRNKGSNAFDP